MAYGFNDDKTKFDLSNLLGNLAEVEGSTASKAYALGDYLVKNNLLYKVMQAINIGDSLTPGTNIEQTTVEEAIKSVQDVYMLEPDTEDAPELNNEYTYATIKIIPSIRLAAVSLAVNVINTPPTSSTYRWLVKRVPPRTFEIRTTDGIAISAETVQGGQNIGIEFGSEPDEIGSTGIYHLDYVYIYRKLDDEHPLSEYTKI